MISSIEAEIMENQFLVFPNKIGSSFDDWQLTIKCNQKVHKSCLMGYEVRRQRLVEKELGCDFIRFDPENLDFDMFRGIDKFHSH